MPQKSFKPKILLDEGLSPRIKFPRLNNRFDIKHIAQDLKHAGLKDLDVYKLACDQNRLVVTYNDKDYHNLAMSSNKSGVIGISTNMSSEQIDNKLTSLLSKKTAKKLYGKFTTLHADNPSEKD